MTRIPVAYIDVDRSLGGLEVYLEEPLELSARGQLLAKMALYAYAREHHAAHSRSGANTTFYVAPDAIGITTIDPEQADALLEDLLAMIDAPGSLRSYDEQLEEAA
jgi:hypothetical protein